MAKEQRAACPKCGRRLVYSDKMIPDLMLEGCNACILKRIQGDDLWFEGRNQLIPIAERAHELFEQRRCREFWASDDERWSIFHMG